MKFHFFYNPKQGDTKHWRRAEGKKGSVTGGGYVQMTSEPLDNEICNNISHIVDTLNDQCKSKLPIESVQFIMDTI